MKRNKPFEDENICSENNSQSSETSKRQHTLTQFTQAPPNRSNQPFSSELDLGWGRGEELSKLMERDPWISSVELASHMAMAPPESVPSNLLTGKKLPSISNPPCFSMSLREYMNSFHPLGLQGALRPSTCPPKSLEIRQQRCKDFEENGFGPRGDKCPMELGVNQIVVEDIQSSSQFGLPVSLSSGHQPGSSSTLPSISTSSSTLMNSSNLHDLSQGQDATQPEIPKPTQKALRTIFVNSKSRKDNRIEVLLPHFKKFGEVIDISIPKGGHRAFVQFSKREEAERAIEAPNAVMGNKFTMICWSNRDNIPEDIPSSVNSVSLTPCAIPVHRDPPHHSSC